MNHDSPADIRAELAARGLTLKKRWGQNFLINRGARETILRLLDPHRGEKVWEIGPGLGSMTELVLERDALCTVFEIDRGLCRYLDETLGDRAGFSLVAGDFVKTWRAARGTRGAPDLLLGNLPYRSASLMVADIVEGELRPRRAVLTMQREAADRMCSVPGVKSYSSFSVLCQSAFAVRMRGDFAPGSFYPAPEVTSTVVELVPRDDAPTGHALQILGILSRGLFAARRKTIRNNLAALRFLSGASRQQAMDELARAGVDPTMRAEEVPPGAYVRAAKALAASGWATGPSSP